LYVITTDKSEAFDFVAEWTMRFGKHKGTMFKDIDDNYLKWCYENGVVNNGSVKGYLASRFGD
jgi:uncharacterized protein (DUF3820 family)